MIFQYYVIAYIFFIEEIFLIKFTNKYFISINLSLKTITQYYHFPLIPNDTHHPIPP
jgi:hypothetical protein